MAKRGDSDQKFFVTRESQEISASSRKESYAGLRDLTDIDKMKELDIVGPDGAIRGIKNRVRAGLATFENRRPSVQKNTEEGKIIVYTTSFRGLRHTYEECRYILTVFHNLRVRAEERDIYVHKYYQRELEERLQIEEVTTLPVPQVYINGQHVGGKADLELLNETGELRQLIANIPRQESSTSCPMCGGFEFIPCRKCGGSKNSVANSFTVEFRALKCTYCTENGMEPCPTCEERRAVTHDKNEETEVMERERKLREQKRTEKLEKEKRERIKQEAIEAEKQAQLEKERLQREKEKRKERAKREKERRKKAAEIRQKIVEDIARELEREKQWRVEREPEHREADLEMKELTGSEDKATAVVVGAEEVVSEHADNDSSTDEHTGLDSEVTQSNKHSTEDAHMGSTEDAHILSIGEIQTHSSLDLLEPDEIQTGD